METNTTKFFMLKEYYSFIRQELTKEELASFIAIVLKDAEDQKSNAE